MKIELTQEQVKALAQGVVPTELKEQAEAALPKSRVPDSWRELKEIKGYWLDGDSNIHSADCINAPRHRNIFATKSQAKSALAAAQLSQLMKATNGDWVLDWEDIRTAKYCIRRYANRIEGVDWKGTYSLLAFPSAELRDEFMTKHEALIKQYFEL